MYSIEKSTYFMGDPYRRILYGWSMVYPIWKATLWVVYGALHRESYLMGSTGYTMVYPIEKVSYGWSMVYHIEKAAYFMGGPSCIAYRRLPYRWSMVYSIEKATYFMGDPWSTP